MNFELHAALARQIDKQLTQRTRATRPAPSAGAARRHRSERRRTRFDA